MSEGDLLDDAALGDETLLLSGAALGESALVADAGAPAPRVWSRALLSITVASDQAQSGGFASLNSQRALGEGSKLAFYCFKPATFVLNIFFHVDADNIPRPKPFAPPGCRLDWRFQPDDGSAPQADVGEDKVPVYSAPGDALKTSFSSALRIKSSSSGTLTIAATLADATGTVFYQDQIRCVITPCSDAGAPIA